MKKMKLYYINKETRENNDKETNSKKIMSQTIIRKIKMRMTLFNKQS